MVGCTAATFADSGVGVSVEVGVGVSVDINVATATTAATDYPATISLLAHARARAADDIRRSSCHQGAHGAVSFRKRWWERLHEFVLGDVDA